MDKLDKMQEYIDKEMAILFEGKRFDIPMSFKKSIAIALERAIKTTWENEKCQINQ